MKNAYTPILSSVLVVLYVLAHVKFSGNRISTGISVIFVLTVAFPLIVLFLIGNSHYATWQETISALLQSINEHGQLVVLLLPFIISIIVAFLISRYNKSLKDGTRKELRAP